MDTTLADAERAVQAARRAAELVRDAEEAEARARRARDAMAQRLEISGSRGDRRELGSLTTQWERARDALAAQKKARDGARAAARPALEKAQARLEALRKQLDSV